MAFWLWGKKKESFEDVHRERPDSDVPFDSPFAHPVYRYAAQLDDLVRVWGRVRGLGVKARSGKKLTIVEQIDLIKSEDVVLARLRSIAGTVKK